MLKITMNFILTICVFLLLVIFSCTVQASDDEKDHGIRFLFGNRKTSAFTPLTTTTTTEEPSSSQLFNKWLTDWISGDSEKEKETDSSSKLGLLKKFLSSASAKDNSKADKLVDILKNTSEDQENKKSSSSSKLNRLLSFFGTHSDKSSSSSSSSGSSNLQLAMKLIDLAQGKGSFSSLSASDMKSLYKIVSG